MQDFGNDTQPLLSVGRDIRRKGRPNTVRRDEATGAANYPSQQEVAIGSLLDTISDGEGTSDEAARNNGFATGYDVPLAYGAYAIPNKPLSEMTLGEIDQLQTEMLRNPDNDLNSSALGRYQITRTTLRDLRRQLGLGDDAVFDAAMQDGLARKLLERRGLNDYLAGNMPATQLQENLAHEWASIAFPDTGRALQHTGTDSGEIQQSIGRLEPW